MNKFRVLLVDDEENILKSCQRILKRAQYEVVTTTSGNEALEILKNESFAVIVSDQRMPEIEGTELLKQVRVVAPDTMRILLTGYADIQASIAAINQGAVYRYLTKPWDESHYLETIRQACAQYALVQQNKEMKQQISQQNEQLSEMNKDLEERVAERTAEVEKLNSDLKSRLMGTIGLLTKISSLASPSKGEHARRVMTLSVGIAREMELPGEMIAQIQVAALMHDLGKIGLRHQTAITADSSKKSEGRREYETHPSRGAEILKAVPQFELAAQMVATHHEHLNGTGFPNKLHVDEIPLGGRIVCVANAFDHLLNDVEGSTVIDVDTAIEVLKKHTPAWYDEQVTNALIVLLNERDKHDLQTNMVEIALEELSNGMVLGTDLHASNGSLLMKEGTVLNQELVERLQFYLGKSPLHQTVLVLRESLNVNPATESVLSV